MTAVPPQSPAPANQRIGLRILETHAELRAVEDLERIVWPGSELSIDPAHALRATLMVGGLAIGAYAYPGEGLSGEPDFWPEELPAAAQLVGAVYGFPGVLDGAAGPEIVHWSHLLAIHPAYRGRGLGFALKRAQWQMIRRRGVRRILWKYDPLLSRNAYLNLARLGGICRTYWPDFYGAMSDDLNRGLASDRFQVEWWLGTSRVQRRLSRPRLQLDLAHFLAAGAVILNPTRSRPDGLPQPQEPEALANRLAEIDQPAVTLVEIPADFDTLRAADLGLAQAWREHTRALFPPLFARGYFATDLIHLSGSSPRSFYVLSHGDSTL